MIGLQILDRIEYIHSRRIIHCDIKPGNFAIGGEDKKSHIIYIIDFGFAKKYWNPTTKCHIPFIKGKRLTGTAKYASVNTLSGYEPSRRDDLESVAYLIIYFIKGRLPWQGFRHINKEERNRRILETKKKISSEELCSGCPKELEVFIDYIKHLGFTEVPDYDYLRQILKNIMEKNNLNLDYYFDWDEEDPHISKDDIIYKNNHFKITLLKLAKKKMMSIYALNLFWSDIKYLTIETVVRNLLWILIIKLSVVVIVI